MKHTLHTTMILILALIGLVQSSAQCDEQLLISKGTSPYTIVIPADAIPSEVTAANELRDHLQKMTGVTLPIVNEKQYTSGKMIAVGFNTKLPSTLGVDTFGTLAEEELIISSDGDTLLLAGGRPRGTLYSVYEFLHRLGVRWYTPEYTRIPEVKSVALPAKPHRYCPPTYSRSQLVGNNPTEEWSVRNRMNSIRLWQTMAPKYGGGYGQGPDMHTFTRMLSKPVLEAHPKWMAEVDGKREKPVTHTWGLCLSNRDLRKYLIHRTMVWARKHPERKGVWVGQNDGSDYCTCKNCKAYYAAHGGEPSSLVVLLVNELADALKKEFPDRLAKTLAYAWSLTPPKNMKVRDNVVIMFCAGGDFFKPIETDPARTQLRKAIAGWRDVARNLEVYLYSAPIHSYWFASPCTYSGAENIKWSVDNGITNLYTHVSGFHNGYGSEAVHLRAWLYARLMWDPTQDIQALIEDFVNGYYGPAAPTVLKAIRMVHTDVYDKSGEVRSYNSSNVVPPYVNPKTIREINLMFQRTYSSIKEPALRHRLSLAWVPYLWTDFWLGYSKAGRFDPNQNTWTVPMKDGELRNHYGKLAKQFMIEHRINRLSENRALNPFTLGLDKMGIPWKAFRLKSETAQAVIIPEIAGKVTDFLDSRTDFSPIKPYWGLTMLEYPMYGSSRDFVGKAPVAKYSHTQEIDNGVKLTGRVVDCNVEKTVSMKDGALETEFKVSSPLPRTLEISPAFMLDLTDKAFGNYPTAYVEKRDGTWAKRVLGKETDFWYIYGTIDITNSTGRVVFASEKRPEGVLLVFDPAQVKKLVFEYDTYANWPEDQGRMVWIMPTSDKMNAAAKQTVSVKTSLRILLDASAFVTSTANPTKTATTPK